MDTCINNWFGTCQLAEDLQCNDTSYEPQNDEEFCCDGNCLCQCEVGSDCDIFEEY